MTPDLRSRIEQRMTLRDRIAARVASRKPNVPDDGSGFAGEAAKGAGRATASIGAGLLSSAGPVAQYLGEAVSGAAAFPFQVYQGAAELAGQPALAAQFGNTAEQIASRGIDAARVLRGGIENTRIGGVATPGQLAQVPRSIARSDALAPSARATADLRQMAEGQNLLPQTGAGWGSLAGEQVPTMGLALGTTATVGPGVGLAVTGMAAGAQEYEATIAQLQEQYPGRPMDFYEGEAARRFVQTAAVESVTERLPIGEILTGKLARTFAGKAFQAWPKWAKILGQQIAKGGTSALAEGGEEMVAEGAGSTGDYIAGDQNAFENIGTRLATSGLIGGAMGGGLGLAIPGGMDAPPPASPPTRPDGFRGPTDGRQGAQPIAQTAQSPEAAQTPPSRPTNAAQTPPSALDEAAAMAEDRLDERYRMRPTAPNPVDAPSVDQSAPTGLAERDSEAQVLGSLGITPERFAELQNEQRIQAARRDPGQAFLDGHITQQELAALLEERVAADPQEQERRRLEAQYPSFVPLAEQRRQQTPYRVDRPARPTVTLKPSTTPGMNPGPTPGLRVPDRLGVLQRVPEVQRQGASSKSPEAGTSSASPPGSGRATPASAEDATRTSPPTNGASPATAPSPRTSQGSGAQIQGGSPSPQSTREPWQMTPEQHAQHVATTNGFDPNNVVGFSEDGMAVVRPGTKDSRTVGNARGSLRDGIAANGRINAALLDGYNRTHGDRPISLPAHYERKGDFYEPSLPAKPDSSREPWQMTRGEFRDWSYTKEYREARAAAEQADKAAENAVTEMEREVGVSSRSSMQGLGGVDGVSPKAFGLVQAADAMRQQKEFDAALEAMPEQFKKKHADAVAKWERAHARARSFEDFNTAQDMEKEYGLSNPSESPNSSNPPAKPDSSPLAALGGVRKKYRSGERTFTVDYIASPDDPRTAFVTGLGSEGSGGSFADIAARVGDDLKSDGFTKVEYRADDEDGRAPARKRMFERIIQQQLNSSPQPQGDAAATTNQEPTNGEEEAAQAEVLTDGAPAPAASSDPRGTGAGSAAPTQEELERFQLLRKYDNKWQYKFYPQGTWKYSNSFESAFEQATKAYQNAKPGELITREQAYDKANEDEYAALHDIYKNMTIEQVEKIRNTAAGTRGVAPEKEFNGNGGRYTAGAVANQAARDAGDLVMKLGRYIEERKKRSPQPAPAKVEGKGKAVEAKTEPVKPAKKARAASTAPDKKIGDAGDKIGGARKDVWAKRGLTVSDIEKMNEREAFKHTNKDAAWPKPDYEAMVAAGVEPSAARLLKTIRDRIAATPKDTHDDRVRFLQGMAVVRPLWEAAKTVADVNALANNVMTAFGFQKSATDKDLIPGWRNTPEAKQYFSLFKDRKSPFELRYIDARRAAREIAAGWPSKKGEGAEWFDIRKKADGAYLLFKKSNPYQPIVRDVFTSEEAARAYAAEHFDKGGRQKTNGPQRPTVEGVTRSGPDYRKGRDIDSNEFREAFGFRGVEFGNWMTQADRQQTMNHAYDGLMDLATAMGIPPLAVSLNGHLAAAFGARGLGGQGAAAHYEPTRRVFNLTKLSGQGSLAHEWGHAFDDYIGTMTGVATNSVPFATDLRKKPNNTLRPEVLSALRNAMDVIRSIPATAEQEIADHADNLAKSRKQLGLWFDSWKRAFTQGRNVRSKKIEPTAAQIQKFSDILDSAREAVVPGDAINEAAELWGSVYGVKVDKETADALRHYAENIPRRSKIIADLASGAKAPSTIRDTNVLAASKEADTKRSSPYYATDTELFARMFEMWVYDRLAADAGKKNVGVSQYLVNNISEAEAASPMYWQGVHAFGTERTAIGKAMGELVASLRVQDTVDGEVTADAPVKTNASASERAMSTLERIAADAAARMEARAKKRGARLYSTIIPIMHPLDIIDTSAWVAAHALRATIKGGRALTAFIDAKLAERFPGVQYDKRAVRKTVAAYLKNATTEKDIYDAWKTANSRESKRRIAAVAGESPDPKAVKEAAATGAAERPDVAAKIIDAVRRGLRQGRAEGMRTASDALKPLIRQARDAAKRARAVAAIETRGAVDRAKNDAKEQAATEKGIRDQAVRLVQETPIAGRRKYLRAVASAATMGDLARILHRLRGDLAKETGRHFALRAERLAKLFKKLDEHRREESAKLLDDIRKAYAALRDKDTGTARREELAEMIRESFERMNTIAHEQRSADKVYMLGRAIELDKHRDQMMTAIEKQAELPAPENPKEDREPTWLKQKIRKYADFRTLMQILDRVWDESGIFAKARRAMSARRTAELAKNQEFIDRAEKIVQANGYKSWSDFMERTEGAMGDSGTEWVVIDLGAVGRITVGQAMALYAQDAETKELMHAGQPWRLNRNGDPFVIDDYKLAELESKLTAGQKRIARQINALRSDMQFDRADAVYKRITGNHMTKVEGHYPRKRILDKSGSEDTVDIAKMALGEWAVQSLENAGFTIKRVKDKKTPLLLEDFGSVQVRSFQGTEMMIQRAELVKYLKATLFNPDISDAIAKRYGGAMMRRLTQVVSEYSGNSMPESDSAIRKISANVARTMTQVNPGTWLRNLSTVYRLPLAMLDGRMLGAASVAAAIPKALANWNKTLKILMEHSPDLRHRWSHAGAAISVMPSGAAADVDSHFIDASKATVRQVIHAVRAWNQPRNAARRARQTGKAWGQLLDSIKAGNAFDAFAAVVAYHAMRSKAPESLSPRAADKWAARRAADAFMQTANTNDLLNATEWQTDSTRNTMTALLLTFTSDIAKMQNLLYLANQRGGKARALAVGAVAAGVAWSVAIKYVLAAALGDDEEKREADAASTAVQELVALLPAGTRISPLVEWAINPKGKQPPDVLDTPFSSIGQNAAALFSSLNREEPKYGEAAYRAFRMLDVVGNPLGPISGMARKAVKNYSED